MNMQRIIGEYAQKLKNKKKKHSVVTDHATINKKGVASELWESDGTKVGEKGRREEKYLKHTHTKIYENRPVVCTFLITNMWGEYPNQSVMWKNDKINEWWWWKRATKNFTSYFNYLLVFQTFFAFMRIKFNIFAQASASKYNYLAFFAQNTESNKEAIGYLCSKCMDEGEYTKCMKWKNV